MTPQPSYETLAELYANERDYLVAVWRSTHKAEYRRMIDGLTGTYGAKPGEFARLMSHLDRLTAEAAGMCDFATWLNRRYPVAACPPTNQNAQ
jgi:hypothetical protein